MGTDMDAAGDNDNDRERLNALPCDPPDDDDEAKHFIICPSGGQVIDCRRLGDVLHHNEPGHDPLQVQ